MYRNVGDALGGISYSLQNLAEETKNEYANTKYFRANSTASEAAAIGAESTAMGPQSTAGGASAVAAGDRASAGGAGSPGNERQITNVAGGTEDTDAVNVRQLRAVAVEGRRPRPWVVVRRPSTAGKPHRVDKVAQWAAIALRRRSALLRAQPHRECPADRIDQVPARPAWGDPTLRFRQIPCDDIEQVRRKLRRVSRVMCL